MSPYKKRQPEISAKGLETSSTSAVYFGCQFLKEMKLTGKLLQLAGKLK